MPGRQSSDAGCEPRFDEKVVDGAPVEIQPAYDALLAVLIPAGKHEIRFEFHTPGAKTGAAVSILSLLALACLTFAAGRRNSAPSEPAAPAVPAA